MKDRDIKIVAAVIVVLAFVSMMALVIIAQPDEPGDNAPNEGGMGCDSFEGDAPHEGSNCNLEPPREIINQEIK